MSLSDIEKYVSSLNLNENNSSQLSFRNRAIITVSLFVIIEMLFWYVSKCNGVLHKAKFALCNAILIAVFFVQKYVFYLF